MITLALDIGTSAARAAILRRDRVVGQIARAPFATHFDTDRAEVRPEDILRAIAQAIAQLGAPAKTVDVIAMANMAPSWVAMDKAGAALTPIVTHQDRRSIEEARWLEAEIGRKRLLRIAGSRPFPGGISSTTFLWFNRHEPRLMGRADLVGHLSTYLHRQFTGARVTDPSNASFMGIYRTLELSDWSEELCDAVGVRREALPEIRPANEIAGQITRQAARRFGLKAGTPMLTGWMDGSAAMWMTGAAPGQLLNSAGSTDVLALCTDAPRPHERLLTRALGIGRCWLSVHTLAAAGSALAWAHRQLFADLATAGFNRLVSKLADRPIQTTAQFDPYLAGDRMSIEQRHAAFTGLTLSTTRQDMLQAIINSLARAGAERLPLLRECSDTIRRQIAITGGLAYGLAKVLHRDWPRQWRLCPVREATIRGLGKMVPVTSPG